MKKTKGIVLTALCLVTSHKASAQTNSKNALEYSMQIQEQNITDEFSKIAAALAKYFMFDEAEIFRGRSNKSLETAHYNESRPLTAVVIGDDDKYLYLYLENCDVCAVLARADKNSAKIEILKQEHQISSQDLNDLLLKFGVKNSICNS